jgi:hypothetical protein
MYIYDRIKKASFKCEALEFLSDYIWRSGK